MWMPEDEEDPPNTVSILIGPNDDKVCVVANKDVMRTSKYFRNLLQPRRAIEGDCPICQEALEEDVEEVVEELTYCESSCGNNFHQVCMDEWKRSKPTGALFQCPMCRQSWWTYTFSETSLKAFMVYYSWLYSANVALQMEYIGPDPVNPNFIELFEAYQLGVALSEPIFCQTVKRSIEMECTEDFTVFPDWQDVTTAYSITPVSSPLRGLLARIYTTIDSSHYERVFENWDKFPREFQLDFTKALLKDRDELKQIKHRDELKQKLRENVQETRRKRWRRGAPE
jgi:hypothetical protein